MSKNPTGKPGGAFNWLWALPVYAVYILIFGMIVAGLLAAAPYLAIAARHLITWLTGWQSWQGPSEYEVFEAIKIYLLFLIVHFLLRIKTVLENRLGHANNV